MPIPEPNPNEEDKNFISRCAADPIMNKEWPDNKKRLAICYNQLKQAKKNKESKGTRINWDDFKNSPVIIT